MNLTFVKFIRDYLIYFLFISFVFISYFYTFSSYFHPKYTIEDLSNKKDECYIESDDLSNNYAPPEETNNTNDCNSNNLINSKNKKDGNYYNYNAFFELNDVIVYQFKKIIKIIIYNKLFSFHFFNTFLNQPNSHYKHLCSQNALFIFERNLRL